MTTAAGQQRLRGRRDQAGRPARRCARRRRASHPPKAPRGCACRRSASG